MNDCNDISILPSYINNCWLNAIIMCVLYSQYSRNLLINYSINWNSNNTFLNLIKEIIFSYYTNTKNTESYFKLIDPSVLLYNIFKRKKTKWLELYVLDFYKYLNVNCIDIAYLNDGINERYLTRTTLNNIPDVLVIFHHKLNSICIEYINYYKDIKRKDKKLAEKLLLNITINGIANYNNEITFMNQTYILASCLTNDNNIGYEHHSVAGIYCNDIRYVYNGYINKPNNPCAIIKYDWDIHKNEDYCFNPNECNLDIATNIKKIRDLCFNFGKGNRTLIYIKKYKTTISDNIIIKKNELTSFSESSNLSNISDEINKLNDMTKLGLLSEIEKNISYPLNINKIKKDLDKTNLEKTVLKYNLKNKKNDSKSNIDLTEPLNITENKDEEEVKESVIKTAEENKEENKEENEEEKKGGKKITKKELIIKINNKLKKFTKNKLLAFYKKI